MTGISFQIEADGNTLNITPGHVSLHPNNAEILVAQKMYEHYSTFIEHLCATLAKSGYTVVIGVPDDLLAPR